MRPGSHFLDVPRLRSKRNEDISTVLYCLFSGTGLKLVFRRLLALEVVFLSHVVKKTIKELFLCTISLYKVYVWKGFCTSFKD